MKNIKIGSPKYRRDEAIVDEPIEGTWQAESISRVSGTVRMSGTYGTKMTPGTAYINNSAF